MSSPVDIQESDKHFLTTLNQDNNNFPITMTTPLIEEMLVRLEQSIELYLPLTSTVVLKRKKELLYVPLHFKNGLQIDSLLESRAYVSAIAQLELDSKKQQAPNNNLEIEDPPNFQLELANGWFEKPLVIVTLKIDKKTTRLSKTSS